MTEKVYILSYVSNTPYHEKVECWFRPSIAELKLCQEEFMDDDIEIYVCEWNKKAEFLGRSFDELETNLPQFGDLPDHIMCCYECWMFYDHIVNQCPHCGRQCSEIDE